MNETIFNRIGIRDVLSFAGNSIPADREMMRCPIPGHEDSTASFKIIGRGFHCFGCDTKGGVSDLIVALEFASTQSEAALWLEAKLGITPWADVAVYPYQDASNVVSYESVRRERNNGGNREKKFLMRVRRADGSFEYKMKGRTRVLYRLPGVIAASASGETVFVVEGEKDADRLASIGFTATTNAGGAGWEWNAAFAEPLRGAKRIVVLTDSDTPGRAAAAHRGRLLTSICADVRVLDLAPERSDGFDVSDWLDAGGTPVVLLGIIDRAPVHAADERRCRLAETTATPQSAGAIKWEDTTPKPILHEAALHGIAGKIVRAITPHTEADPAALLFTLLTIAGNMIGPGPHVRVGPVRHEPRLFTVISGASAKARKGQSFAEIRQIAAQADPELLEAIGVSGLSTGEGLIARLRDREDGECVEKRALVHEPEFARLLAVAGREGSTLSAILRDAWDGSTLRVLTRKDPLEARGACVSIVGHITDEELIARLTDIELANGFGNRILFVSAKRARLLPSGGCLSFETVAMLGRELRSALDRARELVEIMRSREFVEAWDELYSTFPDEPGLAGAIIARGETHTLRLALVYAMLDGATHLGVDHLAAAYASWRYAEDSARYIFGRHLGDDARQRLLDELRAVYPLGLDRTAQRDLFNRHASEAKIGGARTWLQGHGLAEEREQRTDGRPRQVLFARPRSENDATRNVDPLLPLLARLHKSASGLLPLKTHSGDEVPDLSPLKALYTQTLKVPDLFNESSVLRGNKVELSSDDGRTVAEFEIEGAA